MSNALNDATLRDIAKQFLLGGPIEKISAYGRGLINDTYVIELASRPPQKVILQRINSRVFKQPQLIMENLGVLSAHVAALRNPPQLLFPRIFSATNGKPFVIDDTGGFWRAQQFIPDARTLNTLGSLTEARELGTALGTFHTLLSDVPVERLHTTLPGFHVLPEYLGHFDTIRAGSTERNDAALAPFFDEVEARRADCGRLEKARAHGALSLRSTHGDPKIDNFLFDSGGHAISLIDLDTVQPGLVHYDIGDLIRSACNRAGESSTAEHISFDLAACSAILEGYAGAARAMLTRADFDYLYDAIRLIPFELGLRFFTDHLNGDRYFKSTHRGQNLERASVQFALTRAIESVEQPIRRLVKQLAVHG